MTSLLLVATLLGQPSDPMVRFQQFSKSHPNLEVSFSTTFNGRAVGSGTLVLRRPSYLLYRAKGENYDFTLDETPTRYLETEKSLKQYDEYDSTGGIAVYESDINSLATDILPRVAIVDDLKRVFRAKTDVTHQGDSDVVHQKLQGQGGVQDTWATVDAQGRVTTFRQKSVSMATKEFVWTLSDYRTPETIPAGYFQMGYPLGYVPHTVQRLNTPLPIGQPAPLAGWILNLRTVNLADVTGHKPFLLIYARGDDSLGRETMRWAQGLKGKVPVLIIGQGGLQDPKGIRTKQLSVPGSPMFYLIGGSGKVDKLWFGFDPARATAFEADVVASAGKSAAG